MEKVEEVDQSEKSSTQEKPPKQEVEAVEPEKESTVEPHPEEQEEPSEPTKPKIDSKPSSEESSDSDSIEDPSLIQLTPEVSMAPEPPTKPSEPLENISEKSENSKEEKSQKTCQKAENEEKAEEIPQPEQDKPKKEPEKPEPKPEIEEPDKIEKEEKEKPASQSTPKEKLNINSKFSRHKLSLLNHTILVSQSTFLTELVGILDKVCRIEEIYPQKLCYYIKKWLLKIEGKLTSNIDQIFESFLTVLRSILVSKRFKTFVRKESLHWKKKLKQQLFSSFKVTEKPRRHNKILLMNPFNPKNKNSPLSRIINFEDVDYSALAKRTPFVPILIRIQSNIMLHSHVAFMRIWLFLVFLVNDSSLQDEIVGIMTPNSFIESLKLRMCVLVKQKVFEFNLKEISNFYITIQKGLDKDLNESWMASDAPLYDSIMSSKTSQQEQSEEISEIWQKVESCFGWYLELLQKRGGSEVTLSALNTSFGSILGGVEIQKQVVVSEIVSTHSTSSPNKKPSSGSRETFSSMTASYVSNNTSSRDAQSTNQPQNQQSFRNKLWAFCCCCFSSRASRQDGGPAPLGRVVPMGLNTRQTVSCGPLTRGGLHSDSKNSISYGLNHKSRLSVIPEDIDESMLNQSDLADLVDKSEPDSGREFKTSSFVNVQTAGKNKARKALNVKRSNANVRSGVHLSPEESYKETEFEKHRKIRRRIFMENVSIFEQFTLIDNDGSLSSHVMQEICGDRVQPRDKLKHVNVDDIRSKLFHIETEDEEITKSEDGEQLEMGESSMRKRAKTERLSEKGKELKKSKSSKLSKRIKMTADNGGSEEIGVEGVTKDGQDLMRTAEQLNDSEIEENVQELEIKIMGCVGLLEALTSQRSPNSISISGRANKMLIKSHRMSTGSRKSELVNLNINTFTGSLKGSPRGAMGSKRSDRSESNFIDSFEVQDFNLGFKSKELHKSVFLYKTYF